jgi:hypothetical protein
LLFSGVPLLEKTINLTIEDSYSKLKAILVEKGGKIVSEQEQKQICFKQGSLWGVLPKTAKKTVTVTFKPIDEGTRVKCISTLASDWKNITLIGCALAFVLVGVCVWLATDLNATLASHMLGFWGWLITVEGNVDVVAAQALVNLTWGLATFLSAIILLEAAIVVYVRSRIDAFTEDALNILS